MKLLIWILVVGATAAAAEDRKWVWDGEEKARTGDNRNIRYSVNEYPDESGGNFASQNQFRPQYPGPYGPNSRPITSGDGTPVLVGPNGPTGIVGRPHYRPTRPGGDGYDYNPGPIVPGVHVDPILSGPVPSWIRNDPRYQEYDSCKCSRSFNCPGVKFGSCARGKQYCCFSSRRYPGSGAGYEHFNGNYPNRPHQGGLPFRPFNAIPPEYYGNGNNYNGNYNGEFNGNNYGQYQNGDYDRPYNNHNRPYYGGNGDFNGPYQGPYAPDYVGNYNYQNQGGFNWLNPYRRRPYETDYYGRSAGKSKNENSKTVNDVSTATSATSKDE